MKTEFIGEIFLDGKIIKLDNVSVSEIDNYLDNIKTQETNLMNRLNKALAEIQ